MSRISVWAAPLLVRVAPRASWTLKARWARHVDVTGRAVAARRFDRIDQLLDSGSVLAEELVAVDSQGSSERFNWLGDLYHNEAGRNGAAEAAYRRAVKLAVGPMSEVAGLNNLALLLLRQSRSIEAEELLGRVLQILEQQPGDTSEAIATARENLSAALRQQGRTEEAARIRAETS